MRLGTCMKSGGMAALAATLAVLAVPASAQDRGQGRWSRGGGDAPTTINNGGNSWRGDDSGDGNARGNGAEAWRGNGNGGRNFRGEQPQSGGAPTPQAEVRPRPDAQRNWSRGDGNSSDRWRGRAGTPPQVQPPSTPPVQAQNRPDRRNWSGNGQSQAQRQWQGRGPSSVDNRRTGRERDDAGRWRGNNDKNGWNGNDNRWNGRNDYAWHGNNDHAWRGNNDYRWDGSNGNYWHGDTDNRWRPNYAGNWNRDWRRDSRYDWRGYRNANRDVYRLGSYYAPYGSYAYRRVSPGFHLDTGFYGSRYMIADPWQYRLPPAYGPYRWVRYFEDALLVDIISGEVADVIYSFFW